MILVRRMLMELKRAVAGVMVESSFATFSPSMATFSEKSASSRPLGCLDFPAMVEIQDGYEKAVRGVG